MFDSPLDVLRILRPCHVAPDNFVTSIPVAVQNARSKVNSNDNAHFHPGSYLLHIISFMIGFGNTGGGSVQIASGLIPKASPESFYEKAKREMKEFKAPKRTYICRRKLPTKQ